jgi:methionyl-tRNA synthetase
LKDLKCSVCHNHPEPKQTTHLYLKFEPTLPKLTDWLLKENTIENWSNNAKGTTRAWFKSSIEERCITRDLKWGVPVPLSGY